MDILFDNAWTDLGSITLTSAVVFNRITTGAIVGGRSFIRIMATGTGSINVSAFTQLSGGNLLTPESGVVNYVLFTFDGTDYNVNIWQKAKTAPLDIVAPEILDVFTIPGVPRNQIKAIISEDVSFSTSGYQFRKNGGSAVSATSVDVGLDTAFVAYKFTLPFTFANGDTIEWKYTPGDTVDDSNNSLAAFDWTTISNNIADPSKVLTWNFADAYTVPYGDGVAKTSGGIADNTECTSNETFTVGDTLQVFLPIIGPNNQWMRIWLANGSDYIGIFTNGGLSLEPTYTGGGAGGITQYNRDIWLRIKLVTGSVEYYVSSNGVDYVQKTTLPITVNDTLIRNAVLRIVTPGNTVPEIIKL